jgi:hypothetical protein
MSNNLVVNGFIVPKQVYLELINVYGLTHLEAMLVILDNT